MEELKRELSEIDGEGEKLTRPEIQRYSRQLLLPEIGVNGQIALKKTSVLIVGAGGLGCPSGVYLAASGIGTIGIVDHDTIELDNLHRQILHKEKNIGNLKTESFADALSDLNSSIKCVRYPLLLDSNNIGDIITQYDIVLDATDNVTTRYLLNDACVIYKKPLISGSALRFEGQLTIYNFKGGPCYRCLFPVPPSPEHVTNCSEGGVLGVVPGIIGSLQAMEAIKIALGLQVLYSEKLLLFHALEGFRTIKLRPRNRLCAVCGDNPTIIKLIDYEQFCGAGPCDKVPDVELLSDDERILCQDYKTLVDQGVKHLLIDVRSAPEYEICHLPNGINIPFTELSRTDELENLTEYLKSLRDESDIPLEGYVVCRRGNNSQKAIKIFKEKLDENVIWKDLKGGLTAWVKEVDPSFPVY